MRLNIMIEGQEGVTYDDLLAVTRRAAQLGFAGVYRSDHYTSGAAPDELGSTDAWATLAGLARETQDITIGTLVSPATFRPIGNLAKLAATVSAMAGASPHGGSRVVLGMGTGWMEVEHRRHGFPFEDTTTRFRRLEEHLEALHRFWDPQRQPFDLDGDFVTVRGGRFLPAPEPRPRIIVGGSGMRRTPALAARYADELNGTFLTPPECRRQRAALEAACRDAGRDTASVTYSVMTRCLVGRTEAELRDRAARTLERGYGKGDSVDDFIASFRDAWLAGTTDEVASRLQELADAGVDQVMFQHLLVDDMDMLDVVAEDLLDAVA